MDKEIEKEYKVGDDVWIVLYPLLIKCKITAVDNYFRKQSPSAYLFYDVDEPIGHSFAYYDFFDSFNDAKDELYWQHENYCEHRSDSKEIHLWKTDKTLARKTLKINRENTIRFIKSTWGPGGVSDKDYAKMDAEFHIGIYPKKKRGTDWFNVFDLGE